MLRARGTTVRTALVAVAMLVGAATVPLGPPTAAVAAADPTVPSALAGRYLGVRPALGPTTVVDIRGESNDRKLLAATLQGVVNRTEARIYLLGARGDGSDEHWLADYQARGLITVTATIDLDAAVHRFRGEVAGYVEATASEPWTVNTATSAAGAEGGVVATEATAALLDGEGIAKLADHRGRWPDAVAAYRGAAAEYRAKLPFGAVAIQKPDNHLPRDLFVQQGVFVVFTRPSAADYDAVYDLIETFPTRHPVYGYISDTGDEEVEAIVRLARTGRYLVPTDTTANLSFHQAVGGDQRAKPAATRPVVAPCSADTVNVVLSFSDGDNLVIPESYYQGGDHWNSPRRGELPIGWGLSPAASVLMPAIYDTYVGGTTEADEIVDIMGLGYSVPSLMPDGASFVADDMRLRSALGLRSHWALDALLSDPAAKGWGNVVAAAAQTGAPPDGMLLNYETWPGPGFFHAPDGMPVLASRVQGYDNGASDIAAQIQALVDGPASARSLVNFFAVTVWYSSYASLADAMAPLQAEGVRFLTPAQAFACLPAAPPTTTTTSTPTASSVPSSTTAPVAPTSATTPAAVEPVGGGPALPAVAVDGTPAYTG